jgi:predicted nucleic acid-binding protein
MCSGRYIELLQGVANDDDARWREEYLSTQSRVEATDAWATSVAAARLCAACRATGFTIRSARDCWIARLAIEHGIPLLHADPDCDHIARVEPALSIYHEGTTYREGTTHASV